MTEARPEDIARELSDFEVTRWLSRAPHPYTISDAKAFLAANETGDKAVRAIFDDEGLAGVVGMERELGFWIARRAWGRGYATWAASAMLAQHFFETDAPVISGYHHGNAASARVQERLGFRPTHEETVMPLSTGRETLLHRTRLTQDDWLAAQGLPLDAGACTVRPLKTTDAGALRRIVTQAEVGRMLFLFSADWTEDAARDFMLARLYTRRLGFRLAIADAADRFVGSIGVHTGEKPDIFYFLDPGAAGQGRMTAVLRAFVSFLFVRFDMPALRADVFTDNPASARVLEKSGFVRVGEGMGTSAQRLEPAPVWLYRLSRERFAAVAGPRKDSA